MIISNNINCIGSCLPNFNVEKNNIKYTKDNLKKIALTDNNGKSINIGILTNEIANDIDLQQLYASANYSISNESGYNGFNFGQEFNFGSITKINNVDNIGITLPINSKKMTSTNVQSNVKPDQITEGIGCAKISLGKDENEDEITRFILPAHGVIQLDENTYATADENGNITPGTVILNAKDFSVSPLGKSSFKIGNLSWEFNTKDLIKIKYNNNTWFSLRVITATAELIEGLCSEVPTPKLELTSEKSFEFPITPGQTFNLNCTYSLVPIFDWFNNLWSNFGTESLPKDIAKMGKFFYQTVQSLNLSEGWEIIADAFNAAVKLISYPIRHPINTAIFSLALGKFDYSTLLAISFCDMYNDVLNIVVRAYLFLSKLFIGYKYQTLLVENTDISNLLFNSSAFINKSIYSDGNNIIISKFDNYYSIPNDMDKDNIGDLINKLSNSLKKNFESGLDKLGIDESNQLAENFAKHMTITLSEVVNLSFPLDATFIWDIICETSDNPDELNYVLNNLKTNDFDDKETLEFKSSYEYLEIEPAEVDVKIILPEITVNDITINYMLNGEEFTKELTAELNSNYSKEYLEFVAENDLPKGLTLDSKGKLHGIIEEEFDPIGFNTTDISVTYPGAEKKTLTITWEAVTPKLKVSGYKDTEYDQLSEFNDTYTIKYISESAIIAEAGDSKSGIGKYINIDYWPQNTDNEWYNCILDISTADAEGIRYHDTTLRANSNGDLTTVNSLKFKRYRDDEEPILIKILK